MAKTASKGAGEQGSEPTLPLLELLRIPVFIEWRWGAREPKVVRLKSPSGAVLTDFSWLIAIGGGVLLAWATFSTLASRWADPLAEIGTAMAVVGVVTLNVDAARTGKGKSFWRAIAVLFGAVGLGLVFGGVVHSEQWISVFSHLAVGLLAVVILDTALVGAYNAAKKWSEGARYALVLTNRGWPLSVQRVDASGDGSSSSGSVKT